MYKCKEIIWLLMLCVSILFSISVQADTGPKPSVKITFENMSDEICYGTLLSKEESTGPSSVWKGEGEKPHVDREDYDIWKAFVDYKDSDEYNFLQEMWQCNEEKKLEWTYYPPSSFKILLYYPESNTFVVSGIYERYAFDSYFTVDMSKVKSGFMEAQRKIVAEKSYDYKWELISLVCRILITILIEIGIALLFGFCKRKELAIIFGVNVVTQVILNVALNIINYNRGATAFVIDYVLFEVIVFMIEVVLYNGLLNKTGEGSVSSKKIVLYTLAANVCSFAGGLAIAKMLPGIF